MASSGPRYPGTVATEVGPSGDNNWTSAANVGADDGAEASITASTYDANDHSYRLKATNFGFAIPAGATIDGIVVEIEQRRFAGAARDQEVRLYDSTGTLVGTDKATATAWPATATVATYGGSADTWAAGLDAADINSSAFGVAVIVAATAANTDIGIDFIRVTVHYTASLDVDLAGVAAATASMTGDLVVPVTGDNAFEDAVLADSVAVMWSLEEASGNLTDIIAGATATANGSPTYGATGPIAGKTAITFDNVDDFFNAGNLAAANFGTGDFAAEAWFKTSDTNYGFIVGKKGDTGPGAGWQIDLDNAGNFRFECSNGSTHNVYTVSSSGYRDGAWHHLIATRLNGTLRLYLDGVQLGSGLASSVDVSTAVDLRIGRTGEASTFWNGDLAYVELYGAGLTEAQAATHFDAASGGATFDLAGTAAATASATGAIAHTYGVAGTASATASVTGALGVAYPLSGVAAATAAMSGDATVGMSFPLAGVAAAVADVTGAVTLAYGLAGAAAATASLSGAPAIAYPLAGTAQATASLSGDATIGSDIDLAGVAAAVASMAGGATIAYPLGGTAAGIATANGDLAHVYALAGQASASASLSGAVALTFALAGSADASAAAAGQLALAYALAGVADATAALAADLSLAEFMALGDATATVTSAHEATATVSAEHVATATTTSDHNASPTVA